MSAKRPPEMPRDHLGAAAAAGRPRRFLEVGQAAEADHRVDRQRIGACAAANPAGSRGRAASQSARWPPALWPMATSAGEIEIVARGMGAQRVGGRGGVLEGAGIAAAGAVDAAIVDVPDRDAAPPEIVGDPVHDPPVGDLGLPAAAMDHEHGRMRAVARGEPEVDDLERVLAIGDRRARRRPRPLEQVRPGHQGGAVRGVRGPAHGASG